MAADTPYAARFELDELIEQGRDNLLQCRTYRAGALATPTSGTVSVVDAAGNAVVDAAAITVTNGVATYNLLAALVASATRSEGWMVLWSLLMPDGLVHQFRNSAALVRARLYPVVTEADLYRVASSLDPAGRSPLTGAAAYTDKLDEAWLQIEHRMIAAGNRPNLVLSPTALRDPHLYLTLALIFEDLATRLNQGYQASADGFRKRFDEAWGRIRWVYDADDDGRPDDGLGRRQGAMRTVFLGSPGGSRRRGPW